MRDFAEAHYLKEHMVVQISSFKMYFKLGHIFICTSLLVK